MILGIDISNPFLIYSTMAPFRFSAKWRKPYC